MKIVKVMTNIVTFPYGDYLYDGKVGDIVDIPVLNKLYRGIVIEENITSPFKLRDASFTGFRVNRNYIKFLQQFAIYNIVEVASIIKTIMNFYSSNIKSVVQDINIPVIKLNDEQNAVLEKFRENTKNIFLLWGVTGSGKTETFFKMACDILEKNQQVLLILPEIILNQSLSYRFQLLFGCEPVIWNSKSRNKTIFMNIVNGTSKFIIGTRSALFLPFHNLGMIIIDEEHDKIHKQQQRVIYNCRDSAVLMGKIFNIPVVLASATPSIESYYNLLANKYVLLKLTNRFQGTLPTISITRTLDILPQSTLDKCKEVLDKNEQIIFFFNRRGFSNYIVCTGCKCNIICEDCELNIVWHKKHDKYICHKCDKTYQFMKCPYCLAPDSLSCLGYGVEKITFLLKKHFPDKNIVTLSSDFYSKAQDIEQFIQDMNEKKINIIVGTQMITKGLDFSAVSLVVIVNFNQNGFDFRLNENTFQNLLQISGRAGRRNSNSSVIVQTNQTRNNILKFFTKMQYEEFLKEELEQRKLFNLPPFSKIISISGKDILIIEKLLEDCKYITVLSNKSNSLFLKIPLDKYIPVACKIKNFISNMRDHYILDVDPYDILY